MSEENGPKLSVEPPVVATPEASSISESEIANGKALAVLSYFWFLCIIPLILRDNDFSLYHAKQALVLLIASFAVGIVNIIPCLGQIAFVIGCLVLLVFAIIGIINAVQGQAKPLPLIGQFAMQWFAGMQKKS